MRRDLTRHDLRTAATEALWQRRSLLPEHSEEIVDDVLNAVLPLVSEALGTMPSQWAHHGSQGAIDWLDMCFGGGPQ